MEIVCELLIGLVLSKANVVTVLVGLAIAAGIVSFLCTNNHLTSVVVGAAFLLLPVVFLLVCR